MKKTILTISTIAFLASCNNGGNPNNSIPTSENNPNQSSEQSTGVRDPNASPESVMNTIFNAAKTGEVGVLKFLLPPNGECDGDCKAICNPGNESMREELGNNYVELSRFKLGFANGEIIGDPEINGDRASVNFVFGPNKEDNETMKMQRIEGKWYLQSF
jgi:hypothetical protein